MLNALVLPRTSADKELIAFAANNGRSNTILLRGSPSLLKRVVAQ